MRATVIRCGFCGDLWENERCLECGSDRYFVANMDGAARTRAAGRLVGPAILRVVEA